MKFQVGTLGEDQPAITLTPESQAEEQQIVWLHTALRTHGVMACLSGDNAIAFKLHKTR